MELTEMDENYLLDSNILYALYVDEDRLHSKAVKKIFELSKKKKSKLLIHPLVLIEILSLVKYRNGIESALLVINDLSKINKYLKIEEPIIFTTEIYKIFEKYPRIGLIDASLINYCLKNKINLVTFDKEMEKIWNELEARN
jgi:predicted nucleic acid-binding protein